MLSYCISMRLLLALYPRSQNVETPTITPQAFRILVPPLAALSTAPATPTAEAPTATAADAAVKGLDDPFSPPTPPPMAGITAADISSGGAPETKTDELVPCTWHLFTRLAGLFRISAAGTTCTLLGRTAHVMSDAGANVDGNVPLNWLALMRKCVRRVRGLRSVGKGPKRRT